MCNLYTVRTSAEELAAHLGIDIPTGCNTQEAEVYSGTPGMVVREAEGQRALQAMTWGFPLRLKGIKPELKPKPKSVNNIVDLHKPMWLWLVRKSQWRCLTPFTAFAEAKGVKGSTAQTSFNVRSRPIFVWTNLWRHSDEWGATYSGVMTDCNEVIWPVHDRMARGARVTLRRA